MDSFPKCLICNQQFTLKGPAPYLLPCLHAVCETCVTSTAGGVISCSTCQREVNLTETHLQKDVVRQREIFYLTVQHRPSELLCTHEDDDNQAVCWCQACQKFFCEYCQNLHDGFEATRNHTVLKIGDIDPGLLNEVEYCSYHKKYELEFWDKHCNTLICARCRLGDHATHDVDDIDSMADSAKSDIEDHKKKIETADHRQNSLIDDTKKQARNVEAQSEILTEKINHVMNTLKADLDQIGKEMVIDLEQQTAKIKLSLDAKSKESQTSRIRCRRAVEYIKTALMYSSKCDLIKLKTLITETTQIALESAPQPTQEDPLLPRKYTEKLENLRSRMSSLSDDDDGDNEPEHVSTERRPLVVNRGCQTEPEKEEKSDSAVIQKESRKTRRIFQPGCSSKIFVVSCVVLFLAVSITILNEGTGALINGRALITSNTTVEYEELCKKTLSNLGIPEGVTPHLLTSGSKSLILHCIPLEYDKRKVNLAEAHVNNKGYLVNQPGSISGDNEHRFAKYCGTCSNVPLPKTGSPLYWEFRARVRIDKPLPVDHLVLQIGLCRKEDRDVGDSLPKRPYTYWLEVLRCFSQNSICLRTVKNGYEVDVVRDTLSNTVGYISTLHYGILYDEAGAKVAFIDVSENKIISVFKNIDTSKTPWPMFGLYNRYFVNVEMKLIVGENIEMTDRKKQIILKAFMPQYTQLESGSAYGE